ncbi:hypothetical protein ACF3NR_10065 [Vaginella massiliensis]|uniref:hypothetical protein n=1 Tax=Vaginella massiliensis TaxID=1816680 RepID=UPI000838CB87|nr:hypothetical protein [Vaginella massiliensis]
MIKKYTVALMASSLLIGFTACKNDDDDKNEVESYVEVSQAERDALDDDAIQKFLSNHYFHPINGKITTKDTIVGTNPTTGINDDDYKTLDEFAQKDAKGVIYVLNPNATAEGRSVINNENDSILLHVEARHFRPTQLSTKRYYFNSMLPYSTTVETNIPLKDPSFYYYPLTQSLIDLGYKKEYFELPNFVEGLKQFKSTERDPNDLYHMQGVIILPSRLAFARRKAFVGSGITDSGDIGYRDRSFIFSFELLKVTDRKK